MSAEIIPFPVARMRDVEPWITRQQLATHLSCSVRTVDNLVREGCPSMKLRGSRRFQASRVDDWLLRRTG